MKKIRRRKTRTRQLPSLVPSIELPVLGLKVCSGIVRNPAETPSDRGPGTPEPRPYAPFIEVGPADQPVDRRKPSLYQLDAWERLDAHLAELQANGNFAGLLVMLTGSGNTHAAADWLTRRVVDQGVRVFRLSHRHELLDQAAAFRNLAQMAAGHFAGRIRVASDGHGQAVHVEATDDVITGSMPSLRPTPRRSGRCSTILVPGRAGEDRVDRRSAQIDGRDEY